MSDLSLTGRHYGFVKILALPGIALTLAALFVFALHPQSGMFGGAFYLLFGSWFIPSAINLLLSAWVITFIKVSRAWRAVLFVGVSFLLGMNTLLPALISRRPNPVSSAEIVRVIRIPRSMRVDDGLMAPRLPGEIFYTSSPSALGVQVGSNEGCMCMWFTPPVGESTEWQVWHVINAYLHRRDAIEGTTYLDLKGEGLDVKMRKMALGMAHFDVRFTRSETRNTVNLLITVYDGLEVTATYKQADIPVWSTLPPQPHAEGLGGEYFYRNALSMLVRHNFWVFYLDSQMSGFSPGPLKAFLRRAVVVE
ncbi:hypothetical protein [Dyella terrae]|uniref:hypothetical protein n=1 Tax=Dyella terrae TaxID=522259 RepID=UPI001EFE551E|nr:hypothetical protein [Dyella terrae]ULU24965.1 hypothetical protein DYST_01885 [Dyella terrae]ULU26770.1 hypothetical protein DYST_03718 [Dyella terrae]